MARSKVGRKARREVRALRPSSHSKIAAAIEALESRTLLTGLTEGPGTDSYLISGNSLVITDLTTGVPGSPIDLTPYSSVTLKGDSGSNTFTVNNYTGDVTLDGGGNSSSGGDTYNITAATSGSVTILNNAGASYPNALRVTSPTSVPETTTVGGNVVSVGGYTVTNNDSQVTSLALFGQIFGSADALIVNGSGPAENFVLAGSTLTSTGEPTIAYHNFTSLAINGNAGVGGTESYTINGVGGPTTIDASASTVTFQVNHNNDVLTLNSGPIGTDTYVINDNSGTLIAGGGLNDNFTVNNSASGMTLDGGSGVNVFTINSNSASLNLNGGAGDTSDTFHIKANSGTIVATAGDGTDSFTVDSTTSPITLMGGSGNDTFHVTAPTFASVTVIGGSGPVQTLEYDGSPVSDSFTITGSQVSGPYAPLLYSKLTGLTVNGGGGADTFLVLSDSAPTTLIGGTSSDTFNVDSAVALVTIDTGTAASVVNIGSNAPSTGSKLDGIKGGVTINGSGFDTVNIDDTGSTKARTGTLSASDLNITSIGDIQYNNIDTLNLSLGDKGNTLTVAGTSANTTNISTGAGNDNIYVQTTGGVTKINAGGGSNVIDVGTIAPTLGGSLSQIQGALIIVGAGSDLLNLDDSGSTSAKTGTLNAKTVSGLSPADITYSGIGTLTVELGNHGNHFTITTTNAATTTNLVGGTGGDVITLLTDAGKTNITAGSGSNTIAVDATGGITTIKDPGGTSSILVGSTEPTAGGVLNTIAQPLSVTGNFKDTLTLDDTGDSTAQLTGKITATAVTGLGMGSTGVSYGGIGTLIVNLGSGGNTFVIADTSASTGTVLNSGSGNDTVTVADDSTPTTVNSGAGNDKVYVQATGGTTTVNLGSGTDTVYVSNNAPAVGDLQLISSALTINGTLTSTVTLDDTGDPMGKTLASLSDTSLTGVAPATIFYSGLGILNVNLGSGGNTLGITNTSATTTNINSGTGVDTVNVSGTGTGAVNVNTGGGSNVNTVNVGDPGSNVAAILGTLTVKGNTHDVLNIDNAASATPNTATLTSTTLTGLTNTPITWSGIATFTLSLGTQNNKLTVQNTIAGNTTINGGPNQDEIDLLDESGPVTVNSGAGNDTVYIPVTDAAVVINNSAGADVVNVGSSTPPNAGTLAGINSPITVNGAGTDTLNLDDSGDATAHGAVQITAGAVSGLSPAAINYTSVGTLNVYLGTAIDTVGVLSTSAATNIFAGAAADVINVGNAGLTSGINGPLTVSGTGTALTLNVDDSADATPTTGSLTATVIMGVSPAPITYAGVGTLAISLGTAGNTFTITNTNATTSTTLNSGTGVDTVTLVTDSGPTIINTQAGSDTVYVKATGAGTTINTGTPGSDTVDVGSLVPTLIGGTLSGIAGKLAINGNGTDTVNLDDSGDTANLTTGALSPTAVTGLSPAEIDYSKLGNLNLALGSGNETFNVTGTAVGTSTAITTAGGTDTLNVLATGGPLSITTAGSNNVINVGSKTGTGGTIANIAGPITVVGSGTDSLLVDDSGDPTARIGTLTGTSLTLGPASIPSYSGLTQLGINLGTGKDTFTVANTAVGTTTTVTTTVSDLFYVQQISSPTTILTGGSASTVNVGNAGVVDGIGALLSITGNGHGADIVNVDDTASGAKTGALSSSALTGLNMTGSITYSADVAKLTVSLGNGGNTFTINSTNSATNTTLNSGNGADTVTLVADSGPTTINSDGGNDTVNVQTTNGVTAVNTGAGTDTVNVGFNGSLNGISGALTVTADPTTLNLDDSANVGTKSAVVSGALITGLSPASIAYSGVVSLNINLGTGGDTVKVTGTSATTGTVITGGIGSETFSVVASTTAGLPAVLAGPLTIDGGTGGTGGTDKLTVDDSLDKTGRGVGLSPGSITGLGGPITYLDLSNLALKLGAGNDTLTVTGINPLTATTVDGGGGTNAAAINITGDFTGSLALTTFQSGTVSITGNLNGILSTTGSFSTVGIGGSLAGTLTVGGSLTTITVGGDLSGTLTVTGKLGSLNFNGNDTGTITAGSVGTISAPGAAAGVGGAVLSVTQGGALRQVIATDTTGQSLGGNATFALLYDGSTAVDPQVALRVDNFSNTRFDLLLTSPTSANFSLSRLDAASGLLIAKAHALPAPLAVNISANVRNVTVEGNILSAVTAPETSYFSYAAGTAGGVYLPLDNVAAVSAWGSLAKGSIRVASIQGIGFHSILSGTTSTLATSLTAESSETVLLTTLAANPTAKKLTYYESVVLPSEALKVVSSTHGAVGLFVDGAEGADDPAGANPTVNNGDFEEHGLLLTDNATGVQANAPITAIATFTSNATKGTSTVSQLAIFGDGASIDSTVSIGSIVSTGALDNIYLRGNAPSSKSAVPVTGITAPSIFGNVDLFGGTLTGTLQTTGIRIDPATGATSTVNADLGAAVSSSGKVTGVTTLHVAMAAGSRIISRGNLFSQVNVDGALLGLIAAQGNIGLGVVSSGTLTRFGGIKTGTGISTGQIVALGNILGSLTIGGSLAGRIAAHGTPIAGLASSRTGILGNVTLSGGIAAAGAVISGGLIGDAAGGTKLTVTASQVLGFVASKGALTASATLSAGHVFQNATGANATAINNIWTSGNIPILAFDKNIAGDLLGLASILTDVNGLKVVSNALTGTNP